MPDLTVGNEYKPWEQFRETELEYFQKRYLEQRAEVERLKVYEQESVGLITGLQNENARLRAVLDTMRTPCKCDPIGSGGEFCNGGCALRAELESTVAKLEKLKRDWRLR